MVHQLLIYSSVYNWKSHPNFDLSKNIGILPMVAFWWWRYGGGVLEVALLWWRYGVALWFGGVLTVNPANMGGWQTSLHNQ